MDILAAIKREERKLEKQLGRLNHQLSGVRAAARTLKITGLKSGDYLFTLLNSGRLP
jgi:hypothetical protein